MKISSPKINKQVHVDYFRAPNGVCQKLIILIIIKF